MGRNKETVSLPGSKRSLIRGIRMIIYTVMLIFGIAFIMSSVVISRKVRTDYEQRESETIINGITGSINAGIENYKELSRLVMLNDPVNTFLRADHSDAGLIIDARYGVMDVLNTCNGIDSVFIFRNDGSYMSTGKGEYLLDTELMQEWLWYHLILDERGGAVFGMNGNGAVYKKNGVALLTISRAIYDIYTQKQTGMLLMNISDIMLDRVLIEQQKTDVCILSTDGNCLAGNKELAPYYRKIELNDEFVHEQITHKSKRVMLSAYKMEDLPLVILCTTHAGINVMPREIMIVMILLGGSFLLAIIITVRFTTKNIARPILALSSAIEETKSYDWLKSIDVKMPDNEIGTLADSYNNMIDYLNDLFTKLLDKEKTVRKAEMRVLQEQIKPHFLYNSLETISYMAVDAGATKVQDALERLGSFYRNFLSKGDREITLRREINIIQDYISLQNLRWGDMFTDEYELEESTLGYMIPKLILQPLVENSISHGIRMKGEPGIIRISSSLDGENLILSVYDTGIGMTKEMIESILEVGDISQAEYTDDINRSFGLKGTIDRIRYYCNKDDVVRIYSEEGEYTKIELVIPIIKRNKEDTQNVQSNAD